MSQRLTNQIELMYKEVYKHTLRRISLLTQHDDSDSHFSASIIEGGSGDGQY